MRDPALAWRLRPAAGWALGLLLVWNQPVAGQLHTGNIREAGDLSYSDDLIESIAGFVRGKQRVLDPPVEPEASGGGGASLEAYERSIQDVLSPPAGPVPVPPAAGPGDPPSGDVEDQLQRILEEEREALSGEDRLALEGRLPAQLAPTPSPLETRLAHTATVGFDRDDFRSVGVEPLTTNQAYVTLRSAYQTSPASRSELTLDNTFYDGALRTSDVFRLAFLHRFDKRWEAELASTLDLERYEPEFATEDFFLYNGSLRVLVHMAERVDIASTVLLERQDFDDPASEDRDSLLLFQDWSLIKALDSGEVRFQVILDQQTFPDDPGSNFRRSDVIFGYRAAVHPKIDADYQFVRSKEKLNLSPIPSANYVQGAHLLLLNVYFSRVMALDLNLELENRDQVSPDIVNLSYNRNLWNPILRVRPSDRFSYSVGFIEDKTEYRQIGDLGDILASDFDFMDQRALLDLTYTRGKLTAFGTLSFGPRHYLHTQNEFQSDSDQLETAGTIQYAFDADTALLLTTTYARQEFRLSPESNSRTLYLGASLAHTF